MARFNMVTTQLQHICVCVNENGKFLGFNLLTGFVKFERKPSFVRLQSEQIIC